MSEIKLSSVNGFVNLYYRQFKIGRINLKEHAVISRRCYMIEGDPREDGIRGDDFFE